MCYSHVCGSNITDAKGVQHRYIRVTIQMWEIFSVYGQFVPWLVYHPRPVNHPRPLTNADVRFVSSGNISNLNPSTLQATGGGGKRGGVRACQVLPWAWSLSEGVQAGAWPRA